MLEKRRREALRWHILVCLSVNHPYGTNEQVLLDYISPTYTDFTKAECRKHLDYLMDRGLVTITGKGTLDWVADISRHGLDVVERTVDCEPGIARPRID